MPDAESFHKSSHVAKPTDTVRAASFKCVLLAPRSRCLSAPPRAPTIFLASRSFAILYLAVAIISLTTISFVPYAQQNDFYLRPQQRLLAARSRCQVSHPSNLTPQPRSLPLSLPLYQPPLTDFPPISLPYCSQDRPAARLSAGAGWSWLPRLSRGKATGREVERARSGREGRFPA